MSNETKITFKSLKPLVDLYNERCKADDGDIRSQELRRGLLSIRRAINGPDGVTQDELLAISEILSEAERIISAKFEELKLETYALQRLQLAEDIEEIVLEIVTVEDEPEVNGNVI